MPDWAQEVSKENKPYKEEEINKMIIKDIKTLGLKEKILRELPRIKGEDIVIINAPGNEYLIGKSLKEFAQNRNLKVSEGLLALMELTNFRAVVFYKNINFKKLIKALACDRAIIASNSASFKEPEGFKKTIRPQRSYRTFPKFLELAEKEKILSMETAIYKITSLPAQRLGLKDRGVIRDGYFADLVIFRNAEIKEVIGFTFHEMSKPSIIF